MNVLTRWDPLQETLDFHRAMDMVRQRTGAQGQFWEMHGMLFTHQDQLEFEDLRRYAHALGLDLGRFDQEMIAQIYEPEVRRDFRRGIQDGVNGTPSIFINGLRYDGPSRPPIHSCCHRGPGPGVKHEARTACVLDRHKDSRLAGVF